ncbi:MAG: heavy-metal-associated domain-containing protein [Tannerella sp.]|jgi:copper chaperone|nr:heavy-metal-associated domain-containing protein [Tannerella sp.]
MKTTLIVENIKCGGCANSIHRSLAALTGVFGVNVDVASGAITIDHTDEVNREQLADKLLSLGYPETGTATGFTALKAGAKSFVSCDIGKMNK